MTNYTPEQINQASAYFAEKCEWKYNATDSEGTDHYVTPEGKCLPASILDPRFREVVREWWLSNGGYVVFESVSCEYGLGSGVAHFYDDEIACLMAIFLQEEGDELQENG